MMTNLKAKELSSALKDSICTEPYCMLEYLTKNNYLNLLHERKNSTNTEMYDSDGSIEKYRNFLDWLFATFGEDEIQFRKTCLQRFGDLTGKKILITSCGLGEDVSVAVELVGPTGVIHSQDLSQKFAELTAQNCASENVFINVSDALDLPYKNDYFDAVYHFGGINLFGDIKQAIAEMERVCKVGGQVMFGDESVAMHLRDTDYGKMFINNNALWKETLPLAHLPMTASDITISYVLGNCFYLIKFTKRNDLDAVNLDVPHLGYRGGSVRKRYWGGLEGIDPSLRNALYEEAKVKQTSVSAIVEVLLKDYMK